MFALLLLFPGNGSAGTVLPEETRPPAAESTPAAAREPSPPPSPGSPTLSAAESPSPGYYREPGSYGTKRESDPPAYVRKAHKVGIDALSGLDWLDVGLDFRTRYELRDDDLRRDRAVTDNLFLFRTRAYLGIHDILDPFRAVLEIEDARSANGRFKKDNRDVNGGEPIQAYAELYFDEAFGRDAADQPRPFKVRAGRMWFEKLDRRLIGNNGWRNTTNTFQGFYATAGKDENDWQLEAIAAQPLDRKLYELDRPNDGQWFYALIGHWRGLSEYVTLEPYYLFLDQAKSRSRAKREIHAPALRFYGPLGSNANYDVNLVYQTGKDNGRDHSAFGAATEVGYRFDQEWKPRVSAFYGYASGDENPNDDSNERFERFYGFARPWSANDYMIWENFHAPKVRLEAVPLENLRFDAGYSWYWLASDTDRWANANLRDPTGQSGDFLGHEFDFRLRYPFGKHVETVVGYAHFEPGGWTKNVGRSEDSDFFYVEVTINAFPRL